MTKKPQRWIFSVPVDAGLPSYRHAVLDDTGRETTALCAKPFRGSMEEAQREANRRVKLWAPLLVKPPCPTLHVLSSELSWLVVEYAFCFAVLFSAVLWGFHYITTGTALLTGFGLFFAIVGLCACPRPRSLSGGPTPR